MMNTVSGHFFNTENTIIAECDPRLSERALALCGYYHNLLSKTVPGSDVWNVNHSQGRPVEVSRHTAAIIKLALEMNEASGGKFDIAIGSVASLWRFTEGRETIPERETLTGAIAAMREGRVMLSGRVVRTPKDVSIDLGGIAKGYIADEIADHLRTNGVESALINLGGNILTIGRKPDGTPWKVGLQLPFIERGYRDKIWSFLDCTDESVVTSGSYERGLFIDDRWYHHILDPETGMPADNDVLSVTVCAQTSFLADALTTPLFLLGGRKGIELADRYGVAAAYYLRDNKVIMNTGMKKRLHMQAGTDSPAHA